jgi:ribosome biogenesis protein UTP30
VTEKDVWPAILLVKQQVLSLPQAPVKSRMAPANKRKNFQEIQEIDRSHFFCSLWEVDNDTMAAKATSSKATKAVKSLKSPKTSKVDKLNKLLKGKEGKADGRLTTGLNPALVGKAVEALLKYHEKQSKQTDKLSMLGNDQPVQVQFALLRAPAHTTPKPIRVLIPHPLFQLADKDGESDEVEEPEICLIVKEESKAWVQEMIAKFPDHMGCVKKVLGLQSLRTKHARYEQRRELLNKYNFFMADDRILPMLSKALGKDFFNAKKLPIPINLNRKEALPFAIQKALSATYMTVSTGTCIMIR